MLCITTNKTLTSKEEDLSDITIEENIDENIVDKNKRHLPKVQAAVIDILKVSFSINYNYKTGLMYICILQNIR